jgi:preprotein translocase subunit SecE
MTSERDDSADLPLPESAGRASSDEVPGAPAPRAARFGEGPEGRGARRERAPVMGARSPGFFERTAQFLRDVRAEMRRVSWPSANEVKNTTIITIIAVIFFAVYLFLVDQGLARLILGLEWLVDKLFGGA